MKKNGFISTSMIYSFFIVFILLMIATLMSLTNKYYLKKRYTANIPDPMAYDCTVGDTLKDCLLKAEYKEYKTGNSKYGDTFKNVSFDVDEIKTALSNRKSPDFLEVATTEEGMFMAADDLGNSYYYRGAEDDNYVVFAGRLWRIIRINGDGSIRIILNTSLYSKDILEGYDTSICNNYACYTTYLDDFANMNPSKMGYMYAKGKGDLGNNFGINKYLNNHDSLVKNKADRFYERVIKGNFVLSNGETYSPKDFVKEGSLFVGDKNIINECDKAADNGCKEDDFELGNFISNADEDSFFKKLQRNYKLAVFKWGQRYYKGIGRLLYYNNNNGSSIVKPTLKCESSADVAIFEENSIYNLSCYSYESGSNTTNITDDNEFKNATTNKGNKSLKNPVGTISADEVAMAGAVAGKANKAFYLFNAEKKISDNITTQDSFWTMTQGMADMNGFNNESQNVFLAGFVETKDSKLSGGGTKMAPYYFAVTNNGELKIVAGDLKYGVRPVVNLKEDVVLCSGNGSKSSPYAIKVGKNGGCSYVE